MNRFSGWTASFKRVVFRDAGRKMMALLLAVILYGSVTYKSKDLYSRVIPGVNVDLVLPPDVVNAQGTVLKVQLKVSGAERILNRLTPESFACKLEPASGGSIRLDQPVTVALTPDLFRKPFGVSIEGITPSRLSLQLDQVITRKLPIRQVFDSEDRLPAGYVVSGVAVRPGEVAVTGPSAVINGLQQVRTMPVPIDGTTREGFDYVAELQPMEGVRMTPDKVTLRVSIGQKAVGERSISSLPYNLLLSPELRKKWIVEPVPGTPAAADVVVRGPDEVRNAMQKSWIRILADFRDLREPGEYVVPLYGVFVTPEAGDLQIARITPEKIRVTVRPAEAGALKKVNENK